MAYGVAHPTAYAVVCLEIKKDVCVYDCFAGFDANLFEFIIILMILSTNFPIKNITQKYISFFYFMARYVSDSEHAVGQRRRLYINTEGEY